MARPLKVYGCTVVVSRDVQKAMGLRDHICQVRVYVAARTKAEAARLMGIPVSELNNFGGETGNAVECERALANPGQPHAKPNSPADGKISIALAPLLSSPRTLVPHAPGGFELADAIAAKEKQEKAERAEAEAQRQAEWQARKDRAAETDRAIAEALERLRPLLAELGIHPDTVAAGSAPGRKGILIPAESAEFLVRLALNPLEQIA